MSAILGIILVAIGISCERDASVDDLSGQMIAFFCVASGIGLIVLWFICGDSRPPEPYLGMRAW